MQAHAQSVAETIGLLSSSGAEAQAGSPNVLGNSSLLLDGTGVSTGTSAFDTWTIPATGVSVIASAGQATVTAVNSIVIFQTYSISLAEGTMLVTLASGNLITTSAGGTDRIDQAGANAVLRFAGANTTLAEAGASATLSRYSGNTIVTIH